MTDAKKREYPFHKIDRLESKGKDFTEEAGANDYLKLLDLRPDSSFLPIGWPGLLPIWILTITVVK